MRYENTEEQLKFTNVTDQETGEVAYPSMFYYMDWEKNKLDLKTMGGFADGDTETLMLEKIYYQVK